MRQKCSLQYTACKAHARSARTIYFWDNSQHASDQYTCKLQSPNGIAAHRKELSNFSSIIISYLMDETVYGNECSNFKQDHVCPVLQEAVSHLNIYSGVVWDHRLS